MLPLTLRCYLDKVLLPFKAITPWKNLSCKIDKLREEKLISEKLMEFKYF